MHEFHIFYIHSELYLIFLQDEIVLVLAEDSHIKKIRITV